MTLSTADCIIMKAAPICIQEGESNSDSKDKKDSIVQQLMNPGREEDFFVLGHFYSKWLSNSNKDNDEISKQGDKSSKDEFEGMSSLQRAMAKAKISNDKKVQSDKAKDCLDNEWLVHEWAVPGFDNHISRMDEDGVSILPSQVMRQLIFQ